MAPLDWGLGHATRCIPIINELIRLNCMVFIAAESAPAALLQLEFPQLTILPLQGYRMQYSRKKILMPFKILIQLPKMIRSIYYEHRWLKKTIIEYSIDAVISDNRFGLYHSLIPCIYITHQLRIKTGNRFTGWLAQKIHYHFINKYSACWVPDAPGVHNLAGELSHPKKLPGVTVHYIGPLSRFIKMELPLKYTLAILLSGPEPQRTIFENQLLIDLANYKGSCLLIRGLPENTTIKQFNNANLTVHNHIAGADLNIALQQSALVISRSGYTTIMDLVKMHQKAILVPTPGQAEQDWLARYSFQKNYFYSACQHNFSLEGALKKAEAFPFSYPPFNMEVYTQVIEDFCLNGLAR